MTNTALTNSNLDSVTRMVSNALAVSEIVDLFDEYLRVLDMGITFADRKSATSYMRRVASLMAEMHGLTWHECPEETWASVQIGDFTFEFNNECAALDYEWIGIRRNGMPVAGMNWTEGTMRVTIEGRVVHTHTPAS